MFKIVGILYVVFPKPLLHAHYSVAKIHKVTVSAAQRELFWLAMSNFSMLLIHRCG